jgi:hypothetical protein
MTWHRVAYDPEAEVGFGEYTYEGRRRYHGVAVVKVERQRIAACREYQYGSELGWDDFVAESAF